MLYQARPVCMQNGYQFGLTKDRQNTNHGSTKLVLYAAEAYVELEGEYCNDFIVTNCTSITSIKGPRLQVRPNSRCIVSINGFNPNPNL